VQYSPARRTALVLYGTGAHGAYHAGVLRACQEAGVKIDVVAGQGIGAGAAMLAAIDGSPRLWEPGGIWKNVSTRSFYGWTWRAKAAVCCAVSLLVVLACLPWLAAVGPMFLSVPAVVLGVAMAAVLGLAVGVLTLGKRPWAEARRARGGWWWNLATASSDAAPARRAFAREIWQLVRGGTGAPFDATGRRYAELLADNLGQPGFRELLIVAMDLDARSDVVAAMLTEPYRSEFLAPRPGRERRAEVLDLAGLGRDHALDMMSGAMTPPVGCEPWPVTFAADGYWRGETHRLCDRPGAIGRLFEELAEAGVSQVIVATAVPAVGVPHRLRTPHRDPQRRLGEFVAAAESASLHDALTLAQLRFDSFYVIRPSHNPIGPFDFAGAYDEASHRRHSTDELMRDAYEDAYHQFIEPVVGASGEYLAQDGGGAVASRGQTHEQGIFDDADSLR
jgi:hypothetical protein